MKLLRNLFKTIEQKNKQQLISELLTLDSSIEESIELFEKVKADFLYKMSIHEENIKKERELIRQTKIDLSGSAFDKPLNEIHVTL